MLGVENPPFCCAGDRPPKFSFFVYIKEEEQKR